MEEQKTFEEDEEKKEEGKKEDIPQVIDKLEELGFIEKEEKPGLWFKDLGNNKYFYWDFRKNKTQGTAYVAMQDGFMDIKEVKAMNEYTYIRGEEKKEVEEEKEKLKPSGPEPEKPKKKATSNLEKIREIVGNDLLEIFGPSGGGKTKIVYTLAVEAINNGKKVFYYDSERNLDKKEIERLGGSYHYSPLPDDILRWAERLNEVKEKYDLVVVDSVALPWLVRFATMNMKARGEALLKLIATLGILKEYCYKAKSLIIVTSQPISDISGKPDEERYPWGEKSAHSAKEIWESHLKIKGKDKSVASVTSFRSRNMGYSTEIFDAVITKEGVEIDWKM